MMSDGDDSDGSDDSDGDDNDGDSDDFRHTTDIGYLGGERTGNTCFSF